MVFHVTPQEKHVETLDKDSLTARVLDRYDGTHCDLIQLRVSIDFLAHLADYTPATHRHLSVSRITCGRDCACAAHVTGCSRAVTGNRQ